jgi:Trypsin-co-occurring domain 2
MPVTDSWVGLADAVKGIRTELEAATSEGDGKRIQFEVGQIELEFSVDVRKDAKADAGVRIWVVSAGAGGGVTSDSMNRVKVVLNPVTSDGRQLKISSGRGTAPPERQRAKQ